MNPEDEHPKPEEREKFTRAGRWKLPAMNPDQPAPPTPPPAGAGPGDFTQQFQSPVPPASTMPPTPPRAPAPPPVAPPVQSAPPLSRPPAPPPPQAPGDFTRQFQSPVS